MGKRCKQKRTYRLHVVRNRLNKTPIYVMTMRKMTHSNSIEVIKNGELTPDLFFFMWQEQFPHKKVYTTVSGFEKGFS